MGVIVFQWTTSFALSSKIRKVSHPVCEEASRTRPIYIIGYTKPIMRSFKWHGIPVNLPSTKAEKIAIGVLLGFDAILCIVIGLILVLR